MYLRFTMTQAEQGGGGSERRCAQGDARQQQSKRTIFLNKGCVLYDLDLREATLAAYEQAIQLAPQEAILHLHRGHALEQLDRLSEAQRSYEEARRLGYSG
jgi:tetratricopeptide (TPR) repeat protein